MLKPLSRRLLRISLGWFLGLAAAPAPAAAARLATVVRGVGAGSDRAAAQVGYYVRQAFAADERYEVVDLNKALGNQDRDKALRAFGQAEELVQKSREAYYTLELDNAVNDLTQALSKYERFAAYVGDFKKVAEALMLLGATHILRGEEKLGMRRLEQALSIYPAIEPDPRIFNPGMRGLFIESTAHLRSRAPGTFSLTSTPTAAEVYVDGRFVGVTPLAVEKLVEGHHWVRLEKDGYRAWGKVVDIVGRTEISDSAQLRPTSHFDDFDNLVGGALKHLAQPTAAVQAGPSNESIDQLGVLTNADHIFLAQVRLDGEKVQVWANQYDLNAQRMLRAAGHSFVYDSRLSAYEREVGLLLHGQFGGDVLARAGNASAHGAPHAQGAAGAAAEEADDKAAESESGGLMHAGEARCFAGMTCQTLKGVTVGVTLGVGCGLLALGGGHWYFAKHDHDKYRSLPQVSPQAALLAQQGRRLALRGDVLVGAGAAVTLAGLATLIWWHPTPSDSAFMEHSGATRKPQAWLQLQLLPGGAFAAATGHF
jgi:tetratricopeptide (TPR) repeat protein